MSRSVRTIGEKPLYSGLELLCRSEAAVYCLIVLQTLRMMPKSINRRELRPGVYGPLPTFFDDHQELDLASYKKHLLSEWPVSL